MSESGPDTQTPVAQNCQTPFRFSNDTSDEAFSLRFGFIPHKSDSCVRLNLLPSLSSVQQHATYRMTLRAVHLTSRRALQVSPTPAVKFARLTVQRAQVIRPRFFSTSLAARNAAQEASISQPLSETVRNVAEKAQRVVADNSSAEGFQGWCPLHRLGRQCCHAAVCCSALLAREPSSQRPSLDLVISQWMETKFGFNGWKVECSRCLRLISLHCNGTPSEFLTLGRVQSRLGRAAGLVVESHSLVGFGRVILTIDLGHLDLKRIDS